MTLGMPPIVAAAPLVAAAPAWRHRRQPPARHFCRRLCRAAAAGTPSGGGNTDSSDLLRRARQLQEARRQLAEEAAALAAAEGLSPAERAALLEAIGLPEPPGWQQAQDVEGERQAPQQATLPDTQPLAAGTRDAGGEPALPGSPAWRAQLPPHLQSFLLDTGLASVLDEQAEAARKDREWAAAEEHGGAWVRGGGAPPARGGRGMAPVAAHGAQARLCPCRAAPWPAKHSSNKACPCVGGRSPRSGAQTLHACRRGHGGGGTHAGGGARLAAAARGHGAPQPLPTVASPCRAGGSLDAARWRALFHCKPMQGGGPCSTLHDGGRSAGRPRGHG